MINIKSSQVFLLNSLAVPRLENVQLRFHFLRRGTRRGVLGINPTSIDIQTASIFATNNHNLGDLEDDDLIESVCENITSEVNFPTPLIQRNGNEANGHFKNNPTSSVSNLHLFLEQNNEFIASIKIVDVLGRIVYTSDQATINNLPELPLNSGSYILVLYLKSGETSTKKLIIQ